MKPSQIKNLLLNLVPLGETVLLVGSPGVGKTDTVEAAVRELDMDLIVTHPVVDDPTDYKGMPAVVPASSKNDVPTAGFLPFAELSRMVKATKPMVVFMDDLGQAAPAVQAAIMQLVLARKINGHKISDHVRFLAATNRRQDKAAVTGLITPLLDRFTTVVTFDFDLDEWVAWGIKHNMPAVLLAFARYRPDNISKFEATRDMKKSPTPRSVAGVGRLINAGVDDFEVLVGAAGEGFATEFTAFYRVWKELPSREQIYLNPKSVDVPTKPDVLYALMGSLAHGANEQNFEATLTYIDRCPPEFQVLCVKDALLRTPDLKTLKCWTQWAVEHAAFFGFEQA